MPDVATHNRHICWFSSKALGKFKHFDKHPRILLLLVISYKLDGRYSAGRKGFGGKQKGGTAGRGGLWVDRRAFQNSELNRMHVR